MIYETVIDLLSSKIFLKHLSFLMIHLYVPEFTHATQNVLIAIGHERCGKLKEKNMIVYVFIQLLNDFKREYDSKIVAEVFYIHFPNE